MSESPDTSYAEFRRKWFWCVWVVLLILLGALEDQRLAEMRESGLSFIHWLSFWDLETTLPLLVMLSLPFVARISQPATPAKRHPAPADNIASSAAEASKPARPDVSSGVRSDVSTDVRSWPTFVAAIVVVLVSLISSWQVGRQTVPMPDSRQSTEVAFADLPPAYHDEFSYLLQARTFLEGRLAYPAMTVRPDLFHQFHVLNEHRTVSRYFPWTGAWIAPFAHWGNPVWGHWLAGALAAMFFYLALRQITTLRVAVTGGLLIAVSPGLAVFSNLLLAHHPTLLALGVFTWAFFRMQQTMRLRFAFLAGIGLTLAMLARPMTAAGFGLPFGIWLARQLFVSPPSRRLVTGFAVPLLCGFAALAVLNHAATGSWTHSAYQEYTEKYTPRHRFGFNNAIDVPEGQGPPALQKYDQWATNLTPAAAVKNVWNRLTASLVWSLGSVPIVLSLAMVVPLLVRPASQSSGQLCRTNLRLLAATVVTLHLVHVPYWFDGIMHWHYVFETAPLLLMLTAVGLFEVYGALLLKTGKRVAAAWVLLLVTSAVVPAWTPLAVYNDVAKVSAAVDEISFSRRKMAIFHERIQRLEPQSKVLVMVDESGSDPQLSYIVNPPDLQARVLVCRLPQSVAEVAELQQAFSARVLYVFDPQTGILKPYDPAA